MADSYPSLCGKRILFADDKEMARLGTVVSLSQAGMLVDLCESGAALHDRLRARARAFDAVIVDLNGMGEAWVPVQRVPELVSMYPTLPFIIFSNQSWGAAHYIDQGVRGYASKEDDLSGLLLVLEAVLRGETARYSRSVSPSDRLSPREREVLELYAAGWNVPRIAFDLHISPHTVETHKKRILGKLDAVNVEQAIAIAVREGTIR